jgi:hypothetical protein
MNSSLFGRPIWPKPRALIDYELDGPQTSLQPFDIYAFSHITHGVILYFILYYLKFEFIYILILGIILELSWEFFENTPFIINKYRSNKEFKNYTGDSIVNIIGDTLFTIIGIYLSHWSTTITIITIILLEFILYFYKANFIHLSIGSLLRK